MITQEDVDKVIALAKDKCKQDVYNTETTRLEAGKVLVLAGILLELRRIANK
jgi:hypothetical protein